MRAMKEQEGMEHYLYSYLALALDGEWTASRSDRLSLYSIKFFLQLRQCVCMCVCEFNV
jgi:hypothetical protein